MSSPETEHHLPRRSGVPRAVLAGRVLLLLAALGFAAAGLTVALPDGAARLAAGHTYACPMHPEITSDEPGECSICRMALEGAGASAAPALPPVQSVRPRRTHALAPSGEPHFASGVPWLPTTRPPQGATRAKDGPVLGNAARRVFTDPVRAAAYLEDSHELLAVLYRDELAGLSADEPGRFYGARAPRAPVFVRRSDAPPEKLDPSTVLVRFVVDSRPRAAEAEEPARKLSGASAPEAGEVGWLELDDRSRELLVLPESALLREARGPYVIVVDEPSQRFVRRHLELGRFLQGQVVVLSGLAEDERVVVGAAFFVDAGLAAGPPAGPVVGALP